MKLSIKTEYIELNNNEKKYLKFALWTLYHDQNSRGDKELDKASVQAYKTVKNIAYRLGVDFKP